VRIAHWFFVALLAAQSASAEPSVSRAVQTELATAGVARVMIAFAVSPLPGSSAAKSGRTATAAEIRGTRQNIENSLLPGEFAVSRRFEHINALAGAVNAAGLARLLAHPALLRIDLDSGGSGGLAAALPVANIDDVQALGLTGAGITVAVLDSGYDSDHLDLSDDVVGEACFCSGGGGCCPGGGSSQTGSGAAEDDHGHGTHVTGIITSAGHIAHAGAAPDVDIVAVKVLDSSNSFCCSSDIVAGLDWVINNRSDVDIVNMSLGTSALFAGDCDTSTAFTLAFATAINTLRSQGVPVFASTGNDGSGTQMRAPACIANAISVGAVWDANVGAASILGCSDLTTAADQVTCFTNSNAVTDLMAPGAPTTSSGIGGGIATFFGTSQASPLAAACAALLLEADPTLTPLLLEAKLESSPARVSDSSNGLSFPRVDCIDALNSTPPAVASLSARALVVLGALLLLSGCLAVWLRSESKFARRGASA
jgi:subtilisin family serine protease